jgi:hypothetical protein
MCLLNVAIPDMQIHVSHFLSFRQVKPNYTPFIFTLYLSVSVEFNPGQSKKKITAKQAYVAELEAFYDCQQ